MRSSLFLVAAVSCSIVSGCAVDAVPSTGADSAPAGDKADRWNSINNPVRFHDDFVYQLDQLPEQARAAQAVWPETYWPTYEDSVNHRYAAGSDLIADDVNELSPVEKYDLAFNGWTMPQGFLALRPFKCGQAFDASYYEQLGPLARYVSRNLGNEENRDGVDSDGDGRVDECDDNDGIPSWTGLCHAWYSSAIAEEGPAGSVVHNGITFYPSDLKALLMLAYNTTGSTLLGGRCDDQTVSRDANGRITDAQCRDLNAGSFHVALANMLGMRGQAIGEDRTYDLQVWNHPIVGYEVLSMNEITIAAANAMFNQSGATFAYDADAVKIYEVSTKVTYLTESDASTTLADPAKSEQSDTYSYLLEIDAQGNVIGGEWIGTSITSHPDFFTKVNRRQASSTRNLDLATVRDLVARTRP